MGTSDDWDLESICREDDCNTPGVHPKHPVAPPLATPIEPAKPKLRERPIQVHHRPDPTKKQLWQRDDPTGLTGSVARATSRTNPVSMVDIVNYVRDDYGPCAERTVYRHVRKLVERQCLVKLDLGLPMAVYIRPKSRLLREPEVIREIMLDRLDMSRQVSL
jgi:hypothetical protein